MGLLSQEQLILGRRLLVEVLAVVAGLVHSRFVVVEKGEARYGLGMHLLPERLGRWGVLLTLLAEEPWEVLRRNWP